MKRILIANRGEVVRRIHRTAYRMGLDTVAVFTAADSSQPYLAEVTRAVDLGDGPLQENYLSTHRILEAARISGADAIHPGYGFLAENADFAQAVIDAGLTFIGPTPELMRELGRKDLARAVAERCGVPVVPGYHGIDQDQAVLYSAATRIGAPLLIKAVAGGGGRGVREVHDLARFSTALQEARAEAAAAFGDDRVVLERLLREVRHLEVQLLGDAHGNVIHLFERDCTAQRRRQKLIEESPAPFLSPGVRKAILCAALQLGKGCGLTSATTIEFVAPADEPENFYFIEANTRLQVEHPVTEFVTGLDLVELQIRSARGEALQIRQEEVTSRGHAIEARLCAEIPQRAFQAAVGSVHAFTLPETHTGLRVDHSLALGLQIGTEFDSLLAKVIAWAPTREEAIQILDRALADLQLVGVETNSAFLRKLMVSELFGASRTTLSGIHTSSIDSLPGSAPLFSASSPGSEGASEVAVASYLLAKMSSRQNLSGLRDPFAPQPLLIQQAIPFRIAVTTSTQPCPEVHTVSLSCGRTGNYELSVNGRFYEARLDQLDLTGKMRACFELNKEGKKPLLLGLGNPASDSFRVLIGFDGHSFAASPDSAEMLEQETSTTSAAELRAHLPALVVAVQVVNGQSVKLGEPLIILESMKMQHTIVSPRDSAVKEVLVLTGDKVKERQILLILEETK